jgi:Alpha/beta hydrolase family
MVATVPVESSTPVVDLEKWKRIARRPHAWLDRFQLLQLGPWQAMATFRRVDLTTLLTYGLLWPVVVVPLHLVVVASRNQHKHGLVPRSVSLSILLSTMSVFCTWKMAVPLYKLITGMQETLSTVSYANPAAWECLASRIEHGLAYRRRLYDVYLPNEFTTTPDHKNPPKKPYILFFPGALVEHVALAQPASLLAEAGHVVVVVSTEPLRIVDDRIRRFRARTILCSVQRAVEREVHGGGPPSEWVLAGHSMGSFLCTKLAMTLPNIRSIVMWGSAPFVDYMGDLSGTDIRVLVVQATNDRVIAAFATPELWQMFWSRLPSSTKTLHEIQGGTHSGFANYHSQWKGSEVEGIPVDQQHCEAVDVTLRFLEGAQ